MTLRPAVTATVLTVVALLFLGSRLNWSPASLHPDEVALARQAYAISQTGRDLDGILLPLFVHSEGATWFPPLPVYAATLSAKLASSSPVAVRWPSVVAGALVVLLVYLIAIRLFAGWLAVIAAGLTMLTPAFYMLSRLALDGIAAVPFALAAIACVLSFLQRPRVAKIWGAGLLLGLGVYASTTAPVMMAVYLPLLALTLWVAGYKTAGPHLKLAAGFLLPLVVLVLWFISRPDSYPDTFGRWAIHQAHIRNPVDGLRAIVNWGSLTNRASVYWEFLNPAFLFFPADESSVTATRASGPVLFPLLILIPLGIARVARTTPLSSQVLILAGWLLSPLAAATFGEDHAIGRALIMVPFLAILATYGVQWLWTMRPPMGRAVAALLLTLVAVQFAFFHDDYLQAYRTETATLFQSAR